MEFHLLLGFSARCSRDVLGLLGTFSGLKLPFLFRLPRPREFSEVPRRLRDLLSRLESRFAVRCRPAHPERFRRLPGMPGLVKAPALCRVASTRVCP
eukprot:6253067-Prymnesium_polylepis.1